MADLGPIMEDVPFAWGAASKLRGEFLRNAAELERQIPSRNSSAQQALKDWRGVYAQEFEGEHMAITTGDAGRIAAELRRCAQMLQELTTLAREEQERREIAREWKRKHDAWEDEQRDRNLAEKLWDWARATTSPSLPSWRRSSHSRSWPPLRPSEIGARWQRAPRAPTTSRTSRRGVAATIRLCGRIATR